MIHNIVKQLCVRVVAQWCPIFCDPMDYKPTSLCCPCDSPSKNTGVGYHFLLQGIFWRNISPESLALAGGFFTTSPPEKPLHSNKKEF